MKNLKQMVFAKIKNKKEVTKMKKNISLFMIAGLLLLANFKVQAQEKTFNANEILSKVDDVVNAPKDQDLKMKIILIDKKEGREDEFEN